MSAPDPTGKRSTGAAGRVARNASVRAVAELVGKFATLALMAVLGREEGPAGLGTLVFALAWVEIASLPIDMGFDRQLLRLVAGDRRHIGRSFYDVLALKAVRAVPVVAASWLLLWLLGYDGTTGAVIVLLTVTYLVESVRWTLFAVFDGVERGDLVGTVLVCQRVLAGVLGTVALLAGFDVVAVAAAYAVGAAVAVALAFVLLARAVGLPALRVDRGRQRDIRRDSFPFAVQELLSAGTARLDAVLLAVLTSTSAVGLYGAAYRLLESTLFVSTALQGAFAAMFTYLHERSSPTIAAAFARSVKLSFVLLVPCAPAVGWEHLGPPDRAAPPGRGRTPWHRRRCTSPPTSPRCATAPSASSTPAAAPGSTSSSRTSSTTARETSG